MFARFLAPLLALILSTPLAAQIEGGEAFVLGTTFTVKTSILEGESRKITVRLPIEYEAEPAQRYRVVYVLDGGPEQDFAHIAGLVQSRDMNYSFEPVILVGIQTVNRRHYFAPPAVDPVPYVEALRAEPGGSAAYRRFLREEVKPLIEANYRTSGHDAVIGESLAALFIVETLFEAPQLFDDYIAISPSMWWENMKYGREASTYLARLPAGERRLYLTTANEGDWHREGMEHLIAALREGAPQGLKWTFVDAGETETHSTLYHPMALDAFRTLYGKPSREFRSFPLMGGPEISTRTAEEQALLDTDCTQENSIAMTPGSAERAREAIYYQCLLLDLGPRAREGNLGD